MVVITGRVTTNGVGIELIANEAYFRQLHTAIHELTALHEAQLPELNEHFLLGLAYDMRKAYEGKRGVTTLAQVGHQEYQLFHNQVIWPIYLGQVSMLLCLSKQSKQHEDLIRSLERCAVDALKTVDMDVALDIEYWLSRVRLKPAYASLMIEEVAASFILDYPSMAKRIAALPEFLDAMKPSGEAYKAYKKQLTKAAQLNNCSIYELRNMESIFPEDFEW